jgi:hypothetical protein
MGGARRVADDALGASVGRTMTRELPLQRPLHAIPANPRQIGHANRVVSPLITVPPNVEMP